MHAALSGSPLRTGLQGDPRNLLQPTAAPLQGRVLLKTTGGELDRSGMHVEGAYLVVDAQRDNVHGALHLPHGGPEVPTMRLHRHPQSCLDLQRRNRGLLPGAPDRKCRAVWSHCSTRGWHYDEALALQLMSQASPQPCHMSGDDCSCEGSLLAHVHESHHGCFCPRQKDS